MLIALWILTVFVSISTFLNAHMCSSVAPPSNGCYAAYGSPLINESNTVIDMFFLYLYENHCLSFPLLWNTWPQIYQLKAGGPFYQHTVLQVRHPSVQTQQSWIPCSGSARLHFFLRALGEEFIIKLIQVVGQIRLFEVVRLRSLFYVQLSAGDPCQQRKAISMRWQFTAQQLAFFQASGSRSHCFLPL